MAKAASITKTVKTEKTLPDGVALYLTHEEARVLVIILSTVGGHPGDTLRGYQSRISDVLAEAGYSFNANDMDAITGDLKFTSETLGIVPTEPPSYIYSTAKPTYPWSR